MKTFKLKGDENRIYFRNFDRIPAEKELEKIVDVLCKAGCMIEKSKSSGLDDLYDANIDGNDFNIIFTGEETFLYSDNIDTINKLLLIFDES